MTLEKLFPILIILVTVWGCSVSHAFSAAVNPMIVDVNPGNIAHANVDVTPGIFYNQNVMLKLGSVPPGINIQFEPKLIKHRDKSASNLTIYIDKNVIPGEYTISIVNEGADGKNKFVTLQ